ncbi:MAG TPA: Rad52/Rad22 family DNA repair protein [Pyrinomonadaceae bacterium]|nr:Rad52/Rad22 family DNA repair protein [Pyrinomonadaceae bacterium]
MNTVVSSNIQMEKRAKAMAAMGLVVRDGDHFNVSSASVRGNQKSFEVRRNDLGTVVCNCEDFERAAATGSPIRCEHIMAVKFALVEKNTEAPVEKPSDPSEPSSTEAVGDKTNNTESRPSERGEQTNENASANQAANRQAASKKAVRDRLEDTQGDKEMKRTDLMEADVTVLDPIEETVDDRSNVLEFTATLRELKKHVDPNLVKQREGWRDRNGNVQMVDYVEWHTVADILDEAAPNWAHTVKDIRQIGELMTVTVAITIDGVTREGIGTGVAQSEMGIKKAEHDALKRAAVKFGIARELYKKESDAIERAATPSGDDGDDFPTNPVARSLGELVTAKQLGMIRAIARELNIDPDEECSSVMNCSTDELTKRAASSLIQHLQDKQGKTDSSAKPPLRRAS